MCPQLGPPALPVVALRRAPGQGAIRPTGRTLQTHLGAGSTPHGPEQNCLRSGRRRSIGGAVLPRCAYWDASRRPPAWTQFPRHGRVGPVHRWARPSLLLHDTDRLDVFLRKPQDVSVGRFDLVSLPGFSNVVFRVVGRLCVGSRYGPKQLLSRPHLLGQPSSHRWSLPLPPPSGLAVQRAG